MSGGQALNIVPDQCRIDFEIRNLAGDDPQAILDGIRDGAEGIVAPLRPSFPQAAISIDEVNAYPGLDTADGSAIVTLLRRIAGHDQDTCKVAFGTEAGLFHNRLGIPAAICGPGHMDQGHKPDEFIELDQLAACDALLGRLVDALETGL
jgi:acetylornithine deacetylase